MTKEEQIKAVKNYGYAIQHIEEPCLEVQLESIKQIKGEKR